MQSALAAVVALMVILGGAVIAPAAHAAGPTLTVTEAPRGGGPVTVSGSGFAAVQPGVYLGFGPAGSSFYGGGSSDAVHVAVGNADGATSSGRTAPMTAEGSFTVTLTVPAFAEGAPLAVYTSKAHGQGFADPSQNASAPIAYATPPAPEPEPEPERVPTLTLSKTTGLNPAGETVTVSGTGYNTAQPIYVAICTDVPLEELSFSFIAQGCTAGAKQVTSSPTSPTQVAYNADGSFETTLTISPKAGSTAVYTLANHTAMNDRTQDAKASVTFAAVTPEPEPEPEPEPDTPTVTVSPSAPLNTGVAHTLAVSGAGFTGPGAANGVYVAIGETSVWRGFRAFPADGWITVQHVAAEAFADGSWSTTLSIPAGSLDPSKSYQVATSAAHGLSATDRSLDTFTPVAVLAPAGPAVGIVNGDASVAQGETLEALVSGLPAASSVTAEAHSDPVALGSFTADPLGIARISWSVPADFPAGAHTLVILSGGTRIASAPFTVTAATVAAAPAAPAPEAPSCIARAVSGASIQWGVKESFRSYVTGPIARGSVAGGWGAGSGAYNPTDDRGRVGFGGSVSYTGHGGQLDLTLSDPRVQVTGASSATLYLTVRSKGFNGAPDVNASGVAFATLSLPAPTESASRIGWSGASATMTAAGAEAFAGFYSAGTALDPVSFSFPLGAQVPCDGGTSGSLAATGAGASPAGLWLGFGMLIVGLAAVVLRRRIRTV